MVKALIALLLYCATCRAETVVVSADNWCPFTCAAQAAQPGFLVELVQAALAPQGLTVSYQPTVWRRAIKGAETAHYDLLLGASDQQSDTLLLSRALRLRDETVFAIRQDSRVALREPADLAQYRVGLIQEYDYADAGAWAEVLQLSAKVVQLPSSQGEQRLLELVLLRRLDVAVVNREVLRHFQAENGARKQLTLIDPGVNSDLYLGFQRTERGEQLRRQFEAGLRQLAKNKAIEPLLARYGLAADVIQLVFQAKPTAI